MKLPLSTPHGALGTLIWEIPEAVRIALSTPHGALGTLVSLDKSHLA